MGQLFLGRFTVRIELGSFFVEFFDTDNGEEYRRGFVYLKPSNVAAELQDFLNMSLLGFSDREKSVFYGQISREIDRLKKSAGTLCLLVLSPSLCDDQPISGSAADPADLSN
jgi:hypothetical protein